MRKEALYTEFSVSGFRIIKELIILTSTKKAMPYSAAYPVMQTAISQKDKSVVNKFSC